MCALWGNQPIGCDAMTLRQIVLLVAFVLCAGVALLGNSGEMLALTLGLFLSMGWHLRHG